MKKILAVIALMVMCSAAYANELSGGWFYGAGTDQLQINYSTPIAKIDKVTLNADLFYATENMGVGISAPIYPFAEYLAEGLSFTWEEPFKVILERVSIGSGLIWDGAKPFNPTNTTVGLYWKVRIISSTF